jgi:signal transduction histidine kinase
MTESRDATLAPVALAPEVLANISPTPGQRRMARAFLLALLIVLLVTWPFATIKLPEVDAFVPTLAAALFVSDCVTAALLLAQFSVLRQWALLVIASGYLFSALTVVAHALAFPGAFTPTGALGSGLQSAVWLYWFWHSALPLAIIGYALLKDTDRLANVRSTRLAISLSVAGVVSLVIGLFWFVTQHEDLLPITFTDVRPLSLFRRIIGGVVVLTLGGIALWLLWRRQRSLLDQWLVVALCALLLEVVLASVLSAGRYNLAWYAGRLYQLVTATVVMVVLLAEMTRLYASLARSNSMLQRERMMLERAIDSQRREREARLITGDAVAAMIAHEVNQPLAAVVNNASACLRWLATHNLEEVRQSAARVIADGHRASEIIGRIRALAKKAPPRRDWVDINDTLREVLVVAQSEVQRHRVSLRTRLLEGLPAVWGDRIQLQQVMLNLLTNAIEAMSWVGEGPRELWVETARGESAEVVVITVRDSGPGFAAQHLDGLFDAFYTTKPDGLGMGLAISRLIVESHGGRLWATGNVPTGATFQFTLPVGNEGGA